MLKDEYTDEKLKKRLQIKIGGGWKMFKALYKMAIINLYPKLKIKDKCPQINIYSLIDLKNINLLSLSRPDIPLVINFGSCS